MRIKKFRTLLGNELGLVVTKDELMKLKEDNDFITIAGVNNDYLEQSSDDQDVGVIFGDIEYLNSKSKDNKNLSCVFISLEAVDKNYRELSLENLSFGEAIILLKFGHKVCRVGWNGKDMFLFLVPGSRFKVSRPPLLGIYPEGTEVSYHAHIDMKTAQGDITPWLPSQADILSNDWMEVK